MARVNLFKTLNIGVIALITTNTPEQNLYSNVEGWVFSSSIELVQKEINKLKTKTDFIILLSHLNTKDHRFSSRRENSGFYLENILANVNNIDIVIAGQLHFSSYHNTTMKGVPVFFAYEHLKYIGVLNIKKKLFKKWDLHLKDIEYKNDKDIIKQDPAIVKLINNLNSEFKDEYNTVIGSYKKEIPLLYPAIRQEQIFLGRYLADILMKDKNVDLSILNAGAIRSSIKEGNFTENDAILVFPFMNKLVSIEINGEEFESILEKSYSIYPDLFAGLLQISSNVEFELNLDNPPYDRVYDIKVSGKKLDKNKKYKILLPDFLQQGGDGYSILKNKKIIENFGYIHENLKKYVKNNSPISL